MIQLSVGKSGTNRRPVSRRAVHVSKGEHFDSGTVLPIPGHMATLVHGLIFRPT